MTTQFQIHLKQLFLGVFIGALIGFFIGRSTIQTKTETIYVQGETISGAVSHTQLVPERIEIPQIPALPLKKENDKILLPTQVDTTAIIAEYELKRSYNILAFDDHRYGKLELFPSLQYNELTGIDYRFTPITKIQNHTKVKVWTPFVAASYSTLNYVGMGGGIFYHNIGFEYQFLKGLKNTDNAHSFGLKLKF